MNAAKINGPAYLTPMKGPGGTPKYVFNLPSRLRPEGWPFQAEPWPVDVPRTLTPRLSSDMATAVSQAETLNEALANLRGKASESSDTPRVGSIPWLIQKYQTDPVYREKYDGWSEKHREQTEAYWKWWLDRSAAVAAVTSKRSLADIAPSDHLPVNSRPEWNGAFISKCLLRDDVKDKATTRNRSRAALSLLFKVAVAEGIIGRNPTAAVSLPTPKTSFYLCTDEEVDRLCDNCHLISPEEPAVGKALRRVIRIMSETGQRQGDVLALKRGVHYIDGHFRFYQSKRGAYVSMPATDLLRAELADNEDVVSTSLTGWIWSADHLRHCFSDLRQLLQMPRELKLMHMRHNAVARFQALNFSYEMIRSITGWTPNNIARMMEQHYSVASEVLAQQGVVSINDARQKKAAEGK